MKIKKEMILELKLILKEEYGLELAGIELENFAYKLIGFYGLVIKISQRDVLK